MEWEWTEFGEPWVHTLHTRSCKKNLPVIHGCKYFFVLYSFGEEKFSRKSPSISSPLCWRCVIHFTITFKFEVYKLLDSLQLQDIKSYRVIPFNSFPLLVGVTSILRPLFPSFSVFFSVPGLLQSVKVSPSAKDMSYSKFSSYVSVQTGEPSLWDLKKVL